MKRFVLTIALLSMPIFCYAEDMRDLFVQARTANLSETETDKFFLTEKCKQYNLTLEDALIIDALRHLYLNSVDYKANELRTQYVRILADMFQEDQNKMIDWACIHFQKLRKEYNNSDEVKANSLSYVDYVFLYFHRLISKNNTIGDEKDIPKFAIDFVKHYIGEAQ